MKDLLPIPAAGAQPRPARQAKRRILLVDDDPAIRRILLRLLEDEGYFVLAAPDGIEALALANATQFDLALLDLNRPLKDGWETFKKLSTNNPELPVVLIIARSNQFFPAQAAGVDALLEKPLDFVKLFHTVRNLLDEPPQARVERFLGRSPAFHFIPPDVREPEYKRLSISK
jgi:CheY-like chemotaxis protein